jgi:ATP-dependent exoDNAse (exonuclease V) beta subunit
VKYNKKLAQSEFATDYFEELVLTAMDNLNVLYVAFTRARQRLYGWAPGKESSSRSGDAFPFTHIGDLMRLAAAAILALEEGDATTPQYDAEKGIWQIGEPVFRSNPPKASASIQANVLTYTQWQQRLRIKYQALASQTEEDMVLPRRQGVLLHDILSRMQHPSQLEQALQQVQREGWMDDYQAQKVRNLLEPVLQLEALAPWHEGRLKRLAERNMVNLQRELRRPDLILYNQDTCLVYDFKFTSGDNAREKHKTQVREYMTMLTQMGFRGVRGYVIYGLEKKYVTIDQEASTTA